jgi:hypothetical protein
VPRSSVQWLRLKDFNIIMRLIIWIYSLKDYERYFSTFFQRVERIFKIQLLQRKNNRFVYTYLKECYTVLVSSLYSDSKYSPKVRVSLDKSGLPRIIPAPLRELIKGHKTVLLGVFSVLGLHRIIEYKPKVDLSTIEAPFTGVSRTVSSSKLEFAKMRLLALAGFSKKDSINFKLRLPSIRGKLIVKAGPNGPKAFTKLFVDAFALTNDFALLFALSKWYIRYGGKRYLLSLYLILLLGIPFWISRRFVQQLNLGRLGVVYNVSGKARVVAMTNWWIQIGLLPLHKSIFDFLKLLPTDGTFDQLKPIKRLTGLKAGHKFYSLDLSAATDRLPIDLQVQILSSFIGSDSAQLWRTLLSVPYFYSDDDGDNTRPVRYAVGQPMGAYSSWAMLALTHHLIVLLAAQSNFSNYAVLGDDVVIQGTDVSQEYLRVMSYLGVDISIPKSMISFEHLEFAKRIFTKDGLTVSMISPGLLLAVARCRLLSGLLIAEAFARELFSFKEFGVMIQSLPGKTRETIGFGLWSLFGIRGLITYDQQAALKWGVSWLANVTRFPETAVRMRFNSLFAYPLKEAVLTLFDQKVQTTTTANMQALKSSYQWLSPSMYMFYRASRVAMYFNSASLILAVIARYILILSTHSLGYLLVLVSPGFWLILDDILCSLGDNPQGRIRRGKYSLDNVFAISSEIRELNISLIDNIAVKSSVLEFTNSYKAIMKTFADVQYDIVKEDDVMSRLLLKVPKSGVSDLQENRVVSNRNVSL